MNETCISSWGCLLGVAYEGEDTQNQYECNRVEYTQYTQEMGEQMNKSSSTIGTAE